MLVTGGTGFIGSWLTESLIEKRASVTVLVKKDDQLGLGGIADISDKIRIVYGDITDPKQVLEATIGNEIIFHLAAMTQVLQSIVNPRETFRVNVEGTLNLLEAARNDKHFRFLVLASTDKVYGEPRHLPIDENHPLSAKSPYDASKIAAEHLVEAYYTTYALRSSRVRWSNTIGGRDSNILRALPDFITSILERGEVVIRGDGSHIRDYMYVTDAVEGILAVAENQEVANGMVFNLGTGRPTSVLSVCNLVIALAGYEGKIRPKVLGKVVDSEIKEEYLSSEKANRELNWKARVSLEDGVARTIEWYKQHPEWFQLMKRVSLASGVAHLSE